jgi:hypothetical protein
MTNPSEWLKNATSPDDRDPMTLPIPLHRGLFRVSAMLVLSGYVAIMAPLLRQDFQVATLGDTLRMNRRDIDAQLDQNDREFLAAKKRREETAYLKDERRMLTIQGLQATREIQDWQERKRLWTGIYWSLFALAHAVLLPLGFWLLAAGVTSPKSSSSRVLSTRPRKPRARNRTPKLVQGIDSR